jgi:hypothetical protein
MMNGPMPVAPVPDVVYSVPDRLRAEVAPEDERR